MLLQSELQSFLISNYKNEILDQVNNQHGQNSYLSFHVNLDLFTIMKNHSKVASIIIGNYPLFVQTFQKVIYDLLPNKQSSFQQNIKVSIHFDNCIIPKHNLKSIPFLTATLNQKDGTLVYLKDAEILSIKEGELYLQCWTQIWEYVCDCKLSPNQSKKIYKKKTSQSLLDVVTKARSNNLKENYKALQMIECDECKMNLRFLGRDELIYEHCQQIQVMIDSGDFEGNIMSNGNFKILVDKHNGGKFKKGEIFNSCCFFKSSVQLIKSFGNSRVSAEIINLIYLVCFYPQQQYLRSASNIFFGKIRNLNLYQKPIIKMNVISDMVHNYKNLIETVNQIRYPYLGSNSLTALKLVTLSSIFSHQINQEKLNLLIITDQVSMMIKFLQIIDLSIKKFPTIYDQKTISNFFNSCQNSIVLISNPDKKQFSLLNRILKEQIYSNLNFVLWIICEPEQNLRKKLEMNEIEIILDLTVEKNLNVCESVYVSMIDDYLDCFIRQEEEDELVATIAKKFNQRMPFDYDDQFFDNSLRNVNENQIIKEERLATDLLRRYFLKARQYKTTKLGTIQTLTKIAESFSIFRYFINKKEFGQFREGKPNDYHLSVLDVILAIFIDQETSRNKFSSSNTLFADEVSKIMLNENSSNVSIWEYEIDNDYVQETKKYVPRDQLVGMVITKILDLVYEEERLR